MSLSIRKTAIIIALILMVVISFSPKSRAGDDGLYASAPPPGSAFVRFVNGDTGKAFKGSIRGKEFPSVASGHAGAYVPVSQGEAPVTLGPGNATYTFKPGGHYSAVLTGGRLTVLEEPANDNKLKTQIILINVSKEKNVSLKTADGTIEVINAVEPGNLGARPVNPVKTGFAVYSGSGKIASLGEQSLERGAGYAVVVYDGATGPAANYDKAAGS